MYTLMGCPSAASSIVVTRVPAPLPQTPFDCRLGDYYAPHPPHRPQSRSHASPADGCPQYMPIQLPYLFAAPSIAVARVPATPDLTCLTVRLGGPL